MSDEQPEEGTASDAPDETPDDAHAEATEPADFAEAPPPSGAPPEKTSGWMIPKWLVAALVGVVAVCILAGGSFAIGRATAHEGGGNERREHSERPFPGLPGQNGNGQLPRPASGVFLGVSAEAASGGQQGAQVANVLSGSPAAQAGLQAGDVITAVDGTAVSNPSELAQRIRAHQSGDQVTISYSRSGTSTDVQVQLANRPTENAPNS
jgi:S1-C subfamily serine protease